MKFTVFGSSGTLSDSLVDMLGTKNIKSKIIYGSSIDLRDGINFSSFLCDYVIVTNIPQTGVSEEGQRIVSVPNNEIFNNKSIGKAYEKVSGPYILQDNVEAYIYIKKRAFTEDEIKEFFNILYSYYPEWQSKYEKILDMHFLESNISLGEELGECKFMDEDTVFFSPGFTDTIVEIPINKKVKKIKLKLYIDKSITQKNSLDAGIVNFTINGNEENILAEKIVPNGIKEVEVDLEDVEDLKMIINKDETLNCDWLYVDILSVEV